MTNTLIELPQFYQYQIGDLVLLTGNEGTGAESLEAIGILLRVNDSTEVGHIMTKVERTFTILSDEGQISDATDTFFDIKVLQPNPSGTRPKDRVLHKLGRYTQSIEGWPESNMLDWELEYIPQLELEQLAELHDVYNVRWWELTQKGWEVFRTLTQEAK